MRLSHAPMLLALGAAASLLPLVPAHADTPTFAYTCERVATTRSMPAEARGERCQAYNGAPTSGLFIGEVAVTGRSAGGTWWCRYVQADDFPGRVVARDCVAPGRR